MPEGTVYCPRVPPNLDWNQATESSAMKAEINVPDHLAEAFDFMAKCDGQTPDEYIQGRVILYL